MRPITPATLATLAALTAHAAEPQLRPFALTGVPAPMQAPGVIYQDFSVHPLGESVGFLAPPARISRDGQIAFGAWIGTAATVPDLPDAEAAFYAGDASSPRLLFKADSPVPGDGELLTLDPFFGVLPNPHSFAGRASLVAPVGAIGSGDAALFRETTPGSFERLVRAGDTLPGMRPTAQLAGGLTPTFDAGDIYLFAVIDDDLASDLDPSGFWRLRDGQPIRPIAVVDTQAPGRDPGVVWGQLTTTQRLGVVHSFDTFADGRLAFVGINKGAGVTESSDEGIWIEQADGSLDLFLLEGDAPPPHPEIEPGSLFASTTVADGAFTSLAGIRTNSLGHLVFTGLVDPGPAPDQPRMPTIWTTRDGQLDLVARGFRLVQGFRPGSELPDIPGSPTPQLREVTQHEINDDGDILMFTVVQYDAFNPFNSNFAAVLDRREGLETITYDAGPVPGLPGAVWVDPRNSPLRGLADIKLLPDGSVLIAGNAVLDGLTRATIVHVPKTGQPSLVVRVGFPLDLFGDGADVRTVSLLRLGEGMADDGATTLELGFTDGSRGLFTLDIAAGCSPADLAEPLGQLDFSDVVAFLSAFTSEDSAADLAEPVGQLDFSDVVAFLTAFSAGCP